MRGYCKDVCKRDCVNHLDKTCVNCKVNSKEFSHPVNGKDCPIFKLYLWNIKRNTKYV